MKTTTCILACTAFAVFLASSQTLSAAPYDSIYNAYGYDDGRFNNYGDYDLPYNYGVDDFGQYQETGPAEWDYYTDEDVAFEEETQSYEPEPSASEYYTDDAFVGSDFLGEAEAAGTDSSEGESSPGFSTDYYTDSYLNGNMGIGESDSVESDFGFDGEERGANASGVYTEEFFGENAGETTWRDDAAFDFGADID